MPGRSDNTSAQTIATDYRAAFAILLAGGRLPRIAAEIAPSFLQQLLLHMDRFLTTPAPSPAARLLLAHGAGASMDSPFLNAMAQALGDQRVCVHRFEFSYMAARRNGQRKPPPKATQLTGEFLAAVADVPPGPGPLLIGGKSMGGRIASMAAGELWADRAIGGLVCLGYPFHPAGKPDNLRVAHLAGLQCPTLIVQGDRDPLGSRTEAEGYDLSTQIHLHWLADGDHDFKPRKASGFTQADHIRDTAAAVRAFAERLG